MNNNSKEYQDIMARLDEISKQVLAKSAPAESIYYDIVDLRKLLKVSTRTIMSWRSDGKISFSQISGKIYFSLADVQEMMQKNYKKRFA